MNQHRPGWRPDEPAVRHLPLPEAIYLLAHRGNGKPRFHQGVLDAALAGALLAELCALGTLRLDGGVLVVGGTPPPERELASTTAFGIANDGGRYPVAAWIGRLAQDSHLRVGESLLRHGWGRPASSRRHATRRSARVAAADPDVLARTQTWLGHALATAPTLDPTSAALCALCRELGMSPPMYAGLSAPEQSHRTTLVTASLPPPLREIIRSVHDISTVTAMGAYR